MTSWTVAGLLLSAFLWAEKLELTTYYPAPYGVYRNLDIRGDTSQSGYTGLRFFNAANSLRFSWVLDASNNLILRDPANAPVMFFRGSDGNIGIGTTSPGSKLTVNGSGNVSGNLDVGGQMRISGGTPAANEVLTAIDGTGLAEWRAGGGGVSRCRICVQVFDHGDCSSNPASKQCSGWASPGAGEQSAQSSAGTGDPNCVKVFIECQ